MIFYWKKNRKQIKNSFCLWTLNCPSISRTCFFFKMDCFCFTGITLPLVLLFVSLYHGHFLGTTTIRTAVAASAFRNLWGAIELGAGLFSVHTVEGRPAQSCTRSDLYLKSAQAIFVFHNRNCFELCTMCVFKLLVEFFNERALYVAKSGLKVFWRILNGKPYSLIGQSCMGFSTIEDGNLSRGLH